MVTFDTETCGLHGPIVLYQYAVNDGPIYLYCPWKNPIQDTLDQFEALVDSDICGFNLAFDWFHICQMYTTLLLMDDKSKILEDCIEEYADKEPLGRDSPCLKPKSACDLLLHARKGPYQSTMDREDIRIKRVPAVLAPLLAKELEKRIPLKDIYFARRKDKYAPKWQIFNCEKFDQYGEKQVDPDFKDIVVKFAPSSALKALAQDALGIKDTDILRFMDIEPKIFPDELGYAPFAKAIATSDKKGKVINWNNAWPDCIRHHITHWSYNDLARKYAEKDVEYTRALYKFFGCPPSGDVDSELACMVAAIRWHGYSVNISSLLDLKDATLKRSKKLINGELRTIPTAPGDVRKYINAVLSDTERMVINDSPEQSEPEFNHESSEQTETMLEDYKISTKKTILEAMSKWTVPCPNVKIEMDEDSNEQLVCSKDCEKCEGRGLIYHEAALRAAEVLDARKANYEANLYDKLIKAGRFHASFKVIGTLSSRMAGTDDLNAQGIKREYSVRNCFPLKWPGQVLGIGDYSAFEVSLAEACYNDPKLRQTLLKCALCNEQMIFNQYPVSICIFLANVDKYVEWRLKAEEKKAKKKANYIAKSEDQIRNESIDIGYYCPSCGHDEGRKIHAEFGKHVFGKSYEEVLASEKKPGDMYTPSKSAVFAMMYMGTEHTLKERLGVEIEQAKKARDAFHQEFPGVRLAQTRVVNQFCSMRQPGGIGSKVEWHEPADYAESLFGFRRYFTLENQVCKVLFEIANKIPQEWKEIKMKVQRRDRLQTVGGAIQSALFACAFAIQAANTRAAGNHEIQSSGAQITKQVQRALWDLQPQGINDWKVMPMNIHDEIACPCSPDMVDIVANTVKSETEKFRAKVPLIKIEWKKDVGTWGDK